MQKKKKIAGEPNKSKFTCLVPEEIIKKLKLNRRIIYFIFVR